MMGAAPIVEHVVPRAEVYEYGLPPVVAHDITRWGPIFAGFFSSISVIVLLGILGAAVGLRFAGTNASADVGWGPYIWGAVMLIVGFFVGGWVTGRSAAVVGATSGWMHGFVVWALTTTVLVALGAFGLGSILGTLLGQTGLTTLPPGTATPTPNDLVIASNAAWGTFIALLLGLVGAVAGGLTGGQMGAENKVAPTPPESQIR